METGPGNVKIPPGCALVLRCSKKFTALGLNHQGDLVSILGPANETDRTLRRIVPREVNTLKMQTSKLAHWQYSYTDRHSAETLDKTPVEIPVEPKELRYEDEMRRIVRDELSRAADAEHRETFEEADDFDIDDPDGEPSQYELDDMQEDAEYAHKSTADDPAIPKTPKPPPAAETPPTEKQPEVVENPETPPPA